MKKTIALIAMIALAIAMNASIFAQGETVAKELNAFLLAIGTVIGTAIGIWYQIRQGAKKDELKKDLTKNVVAPLIAEATHNSIGLLSQLKDPPDVDLVQDTNKAKNLLVSAAALQIEPVKAKKLGLGDLVKMGAFVSDVYAQVKPVIKVLKK